MVIAAPERAALLADLETMRGKFTSLADRYKGKRFNSPNDLVYRSDGSLDRQWSGIYADDRKLRDIEVRR